jgi:asparagine synthase (glutamine-hydrolysing)
VTIWQGRDGVVVGPLFARGREKNGRVRILDERAAERVVQTRGDSLIKDYWGNYVALWRDGGTRCATVLRDPCGAVPCFMTNQNNVDLIFAHADDVADLPGFRVTTDWNCLQAFILFNYFVTQYTGLAEVTELLAGQRLEISMSRERSLSWAWNGATYAAADEFEPFENTKKKLRETAESCFTAWGSEYRKVLVALSGGLDSSILVNLLKRVSNIEIVALHYVGLGYEEYEVALARKAARHAGVELVEATKDPVVDDVARMLHGPRLARPTIQAVSVLTNDIAMDLAERIAADSFMMGQGGDNLFVQRGIAKYTLSDYVQANGLGKDLMRVAYEAAMLQRNSVWSIAGDALRAIFSSKSSHVFSFLNDEIRTKYHCLSFESDAVPPEYMAHPWLRESDRLAKGKQQHLMNIIALYNYYIIQGRGLSRDMIYPYISQPIVELVLRAPMYALCHGGLERALERRAFSDLVPEEIVRRTGKGGASHYTRKVIEHNLSFFRELILDGLLVSRGMVDRSKAERFLSAEHIVLGRGAMFMLQIATAEGWLRTWSGGHVRLAA